MILTIKTDNPIAEIGLYNTGQKTAYHKWQAHRQLAESIHLEIHKLLKSNNKQLSDLTGIVSYKGPGSFTGLRIGLSVANAIAYGLDLPIVGTTGEQWIKDGLGKLKDTKDFRPIIPNYGTLPHITQPKK